MNYYQKMIRIKNLDHILYKIHYDINTKLAERKAMVI